MITVRIDRRTMLVATLVAAGACALTALAPARAHAALTIGEVERTQCRSAQVVPGCEQDAGFANTAGSTVTAVAATSDDRFVYMGTNSFGGVADGPDQIQAFAVGAKGALSPLGCRNANGTGGCGGVNLLTGQGVNDLAVSPDGTSLYVVTGKNASVSHGRLLVFGLDPNTGQPSNIQTQCLRDSSDPAPNPCTAPANVELGYPTSVEVSPDNRFVYVTTLDAPTITAFERDPDTGTLTYASCQNFSAGVGVTACGSGPAFTPNGSTAFADNLSGSPIDAEVTSDGRQLLIATNDTVVAAFGRSSSTGALNPVAQACVSSDASDTGCSTGSYGLDLIQGLAVSGDGKSVYAASINSDAVVRMSRTPGSGALAFASCSAAVPGPGTSSAACDADATLTNPRKVGVSADGAGVLVVGEAIVHSYTRASDGALTRIGTLADGFSQARAVDTSSASAHAYFGSWRSGQAAINVAQVGRAPRCATHTTLTTAYEGSVNVPADRCVDPNEDALVYSLATPPAAGSVGGIGADPLVAATYTAATKSFGTNTFALTASDGANASNLPVSVDTAAPADVATTVVASSSGMLAIGSEGVATFRVSNLGQGIAGPISIAASGMTGITITGAGASCSGATCSLATLAPAASIELTARAKTSSIGTQQLKLVATNGGPELTTANDSATANFSVTFGRDLPLDGPISSVSITRRIGVRNQICGATAAPKKICSARRAASTVLAGRVTPVPTTAFPACPVRVLVQRKVGTKWRTVTIPRVGATTCAVKTGAWRLAIPAKRLPVGVLRIRASVANRLVAEGFASRWLYFRVR